jgi:hypothetical protein
MIKASGNATGTTGGISRTNAFWINGVTTTAITSFATDGKARYSEAILNAKRGTDYPDVGITTKTQFLNYLALFSATMNLNNPISGDRFDIGVPDVQLYGLRMFSDANATANQARFINSEYLKLMLLENDYLSFSPAMGDVNIDDTVIRLRFTGNLFCPWLGAHSVTTGGDSA